MVAVSPIGCQVMIVRVRTLAHLHLGSLQDLAFRLLIQMGEGPNGIAIRHYLSGVQSQSN
jgi:hypothetical protein